MTITYELSEADYINFNMHHIEDSPVQKKMYCLLRILLPVIFAAAIFAIGTGLFNQSPLYWLIIAAGFF